MITATKSDEIQCGYQINYTHIGPLASLTLDILPTLTGTNTGNAFPGCDGWVLYDFIPRIPQLFPSEDDECWRTILIPRISDYMEFSDKEFANADVWSASFHPEQAISLGYQTCQVVFHTGDTWQVTKTMKFPIPSI